MPTTKGPPRRRTHNMGGCATCRRRHVKCDLVKPQCLTCRAIRVTCEGFSRGLQWVSSGIENGQNTAIRGEAADGTESYDVIRRHLFTEQSMASMSTALASNLISHSVDVSLNEIDSRCNDGSDLGLSGISVGPFRVISFDIPSAATQAPGLVPDLSEVTYNYDDVPGVSPATIKSSNNFNDMLDWSDLFALDFPDADSLSSSQQLSQWPSQDYCAGTFDAGIRSDAETTTISDRLTVNGLSAGLGHAFTSVDLSSTTTQLLLEHFNRNVIASMSSLPVDRHSPWKVLNMSAAIQTLADITFLREQGVKHARIANLCALLAISAVDLARKTVEMSSSNVQWQEYSDLVARDAKHHLQLSLKTEFQGSNKAKYKDQLMAILATMAYSILTNNQTDARSYIIDAERLLRIRGLAKRVISRRARLLHHVYTWFRIVGESTFVLHDYSKHKTLQDGTGRQSSGYILDRASTFSQTRSGQNARLDDFLRLEGSEQDDIADIESPKSIEVGLYDIHLEDPREDPGSMNVRIHGVPETWLTLVSQTTRLANVLDASSASQNSKDSQVVEMLRKKTERLENMICAFAARQPRGTERDSPQSPHEHLNCALNSALVIFFYRRVRNVNAWILQGHVDDTIRALQDFDSAMQRCGQVGYGTVWPAFMAGCEALTSDRYQSIKTWISKGTASANSAAFRIALDTVQELWTRREQTYQADKQQKASPQANRRPQSGQHTWMDVLKEKQMWPMLH